jgi:predicted permease
MKQHTTSYLSIGIASTIASLLLPCVYAQLTLNTWFPYHLPGKQFLAWYLIHMSGGYLLLILARLRARSVSDRCSLVLAGTTGIIALSRICQGLYHQKPVAYLCLLSGINIIVLFLFRYNATRDQGQTLLK